MATKDSENPAEPEESAPTVVNLPIEAKEMPIIGEARKGEVRNKLSPWFADRFAGFYPPYGWLDLVEEIHEHLVGVAPNYKITQVKEKFGGLCFYIDGNTIPPMQREACHNYVKKQTDRSYTICQNCGGNDATIHESGWIATLCDRCVNLDQSRDNRGYPDYS